MVAIENAACRDNAQKQVLAEHPKPAAIKKVGAHMSRYMGEANKDKSSPGTLVIARPKLEIARRR